MTNEREGGRKEPVRDGPLTCSSSATPTAAPTADQPTSLSSFLALPSVIPGSIECTEASLHYVTALCQKKSPRLCDYLPEQLHTVGGSEHPSTQFQRAYFQRIHKVPHQT